MYIRDLKAQNNSVTWHCYCHFVDEKNSENIDNLLKVIKQEAELCSVLRVSESKITVPPSLPASLAPQFLSTFWLSSAALRSPENHLVPMGQGTLVTDRCSPDTLQTFIPSLAFLATCPFPQLTHFSLRYFSSNKPSSSREIKPCCF